MKRNYPMLAMKCDHQGCLRQVRRAPRIVIPSRTPLAPFHDPVRVMTTLHYCDEHRDEFDVREWLTDANKRRVERFARLRRPDDWRPEFERARHELVLVTTPEYRAFLAHIGVDEVAA